MDHWTIEDFLGKLESGEKGAFYLYTPLCGTCQVASKMLEVTSELLPSIPIGKADLNFMPEIAKTFYIESVPCLLIFGDQKVKEKIYAFQSVSYLYERLNRN